MKIIRYLALLALTTSALFAQTSVIKNSASGATNNVVRNGLVIFPATGLGLQDSDASTYLLLAAGSNLTAVRTLTFTTADASRTITLSGNPTLADWFDQNVKTTGTPTFGTLTLSSTTSLLLGTAGSAVGNIGFRNATSGTATLAPPTGALGTYTVTLPNAASTLPIFGQQITFAGPTAARTVTLPDAAFTAARTDAAQTFVGKQAGIFLTTNTTVADASGTLTPAVGSQTNILTFATSRGVTLPSAVDGDSFMLYFQAANGIAAVTFSGNVYREGNPDTAFTVYTPGPAGNHSALVKMVNSRWMLSDDTFAVDYATDAQASDTYVITPLPAFTAYTTNGHYRFIAATANTGAATININGLGAKTIVKVAGGITTTLADNDIRAGQAVDLVYDGTNMQMQSTLGNAASGGATLAQNTFTRGQIITEATPNESILLSTGYSLTGANTQSLLSLTGTLNTSGVVDVLQLNITDTAHGSGSTLMNLKVGGTSMFQVSTGGTLTSNGSYNGTGYFFGGGTGSIRTASGVIEFFDDAGSSFGRFQLGGTTTSFPAIKRSAALVAFRLADDSADTGITFSTAVQSGKTTTYNNVATAGWGIPAIQAAARATAQVAANASVATYTVGAADGSFEVSANVLVTTATTHSFTVTCAYTDEGNTARTLTLNFSSLAGVLATSIINTGGAVPYEGVPLHIRCKASTAITIATTGTFTSVAYNVEGIIRQLF